MKTIRGDATNIRRGLDGWRDAQSPTRGFAVIIRLSQTLSPTAPQSTTPRKASAGAGETRTGFSVGTANPTRSRLVAGIRSAPTQEAPTHVPLGAAVQISMRGVPSRETYQQIAENPAGLERGVRRVERVEKNVSRLIFLSFLTRSSLSTRPAYIRVTTSAA